MIPRPPETTCTGTLFPCTTRFRSPPQAGPAVLERRQGRGVDAARIAPARRRGSRRAAVQHHYRLRTLVDAGRAPRSAAGPGRSEEHTSELQSLMRISSAVFFLKNKKQLNSIT